MGVAIYKTRRLSFSNTVLRWNSAQNRRKMPWKGEKDPYKVWLSEIILQQTRVDQGLKYYQQFAKEFPDIHQLARADDQKIYKLWEGLGYYTRCRNLIETARYVSKELNGKFPDNYDDIKKLKGIGPYTAAAIASFAFNEPKAVVDGNVFRVLARIFGIATPVDTTEGKKLFASLADQLLDKDQPGLYNQAIMDFGAVVCKPVPLCKMCPFNKICKAYLNDAVSSFPVKMKTVTVRKRWFTYMVIEYKGKFAITQRTGKDIWNNLFQFILFESGGWLSQEEILMKLKELVMSRNDIVKLDSNDVIFRQRLTHQLIEGKFVRIQLKRAVKWPKEILWVSRQGIKDYAFPRMINEYLEKTGVLTNGEDL